ncbi:UDP-N-acetylmuramate--L-alanine ligase [bacterium]|nr:UDP-N-acetylmuramate--L-alanine ligase [bacterium]|tara:strand:- start:5083 stop:6489 length:1407 start_codon:yes stop_codon:yes gene_type:complete
MDSQKNIHFIAMGGSGMEPLARWCAEKGYKVSGSDISEKSVKKLNKLGFNCKLKHSEDNIPSDCNLVVYSNAIPENNIEVQEAKQRNITRLHRPIFLAKQFNKAEKRIAVTGTHGKTTTSSLISWIVYKSGRDPNVLIGGEMLNWNAGYKVGRNNYFVVEADESNPEFVNLDPTTLVLNNLDCDHMDTYRTMENLERYITDYITSRDEKCNFVMPREKGLGMSRILENSSIRPGSIITTALIEDDKELGQGSMADRALLEGKIISEGERGMLMRVLYYGLPLGEFFLPLSGKHNARNVLSAIGACLTLGMDENEIYEGLRSFKGVGKRMEKIGDTVIGEIFSDYAHHPTALRETLKSIKNKYKNKKIGIVFEPHRYTRLQKTHEQFSNVLNSFKFNQKLILPIYTAGEKKIDGISSELLVRKNPDCQLVKQEDIIENLENGENDIVVFLGAGSIHKIAHQTFKLCQIN